MNDGKKRKKKPSERKEKEEGLQGEMRRKAVRKKN